AKPIKNSSFASESRRRSVATSPFISPFADLRFAIVCPARRYGTARQNAKANGTGADRHCQARRRKCFDVESRHVFIQGIHRTCGPAYREASCALLEASGLPRGMLRVLPSPPFRVRRRGWRGARGD